METTLYPPVKAFLEAAGYVVKGEVGGCDVVGVSEGEPSVVVVCELKMSFNLELILQAVDRSTICDEVWIAARVSAKGKGREKDRRFRDLCRKLGIGMLSVAGNGSVDIIISPESPLPRKNNKRRSRLVAEHVRRKGDPALGGITRSPVMTAYRQQALACAAALQRGHARPRDIKLFAPDAAKILQSNVYGWFERAERGIYALTESGNAALARWPQELDIPRAKHLPEAAV